jgi:hypothetical protein
MAQNFGTMASYGEPKTKSTTTGVTQQLKENHKEPEVKKPGYSHRIKRSPQEKEKRLKRHRRINRIGK